MSERSDEPGDVGDADFDPDDVTDLDQAFGDDEVDETVYDSGYSPPERPRGIGRFGETLAEQERGESLDQRLAQEEPEVFAAWDDDGPERDGEAVLGSDVDYDRVDDVVDPEDLRYSEVGAGRAGRLVAPDEGAQEDREQDLVGQDVGIDGAAASAEEAAVHIIPD